MITVDEQTLIPILLSNRLSKPAVAVKRITAKPFIASSQNGIFNRCCTYSLRRVSIDRKNPPVK